MTCICLRRYPAASVLQLAATWPLACGMWRFAPLYRKILRTYMYVDLRTVRAATGTLESGVAHSFTVLFCDTTLLLRSYKKGIAKRELKLASF